MIVRYIYAALSAVLPLLSIFRDGALLEFTRTLSSSVLPRFLELPQRHLLHLPPASDSISELAHDLDMTFTDVPDAMIQSVDVHEHPLFNAADALWHALVPILDISGYTILFYVFLAIVSALLTLSVKLIRRSLSRSQARTSTSRIGIHESLECIDKLGGTTSTDPALIVQPSDALPLDVGTSSGSPDTAAYDSCTEVDDLSDMEFADLSTSSMSGSSCIESKQHVTDGNLNPVLSFSDVFQALDTTPYDEPVTTVDDVPFADVLFSNSRKMPSIAVKLPEAQELTPCAGTPSYNLSTANDIVQLSSTEHLSESIPVNLDVVDETSNMLGSSSDDVTLEGLVETCKVMGDKVTDTFEKVAPSEPQDLEPTALSTQVVSASEDEHPELQRQVDDKLDTYLVLNDDIAEDSPATTAEDMAPEVFPASTSFSLDPSMSTPIQESDADSVEEISTLGASGVFNLHSDGPVSFVLDKEMAMEMASQMDDPTVMDMLAASFAAGAPPLPEDSFIIVPSKSIGYGSLTQIEEADDSDESLISPVLTAIDERGQPVVFSTNFPFMTADSAVVTTFGEHLDEQDWTLVNIALNEEGKFVFGGMQLPVDGSITSISSMASGSVSSLSLSDLEHFSPNSLVVASRHSYSRSDSDLQRFREIYRRDVRPVSPTKFDGPKANEFRELTLRQGLINHDQNFHMYEPRGEIEAAVRMLKRVVDSVRIPSRKRLASGSMNVRVRSQTAPRFQYGLSTEIFLGWLREQELRRTVFIKSYADVVRGIRPPILSLDYELEAPMVVTPPAPKMIGPLPPPVTINRNRGGQEKHEVHHLEQVELDRTKALKMDATRAPRHPNFFIERSTRPRKVSAPSASMSLTVDNTGEKPLRRTRSDFELGYKTEQSNNSNTHALHSERRHERSASVRPRSSSVAPNGRRSSSWDPANRSGFRGRNREVAKQPQLATIAGSPPVSPPRNGEDGSSSSMPSFGESFGRVLKFPDPPTSTFTMKVPLNGDFARVDDENAMVDFRDDTREVLGQMGRPRKPLPRSSSLRRSSSTTSSSGRPVWKP